MGSPPHSHIQIDNKLRKLSIKLIAPETCLQIWIAPTSSKKSFSYYCSGGPWGQRCNQAIWNLPSSSQGDFGGVFLYFLHLERTNAIIAEKIYTWLWVDCWRTKQTNDWKQERIQSFVRISYITATVINLIAGRLISYIYVYVYIDTITHTLLIAVNINIKK